MGDSSSAWGVKTQELVKCLPICTSWLCFSMLQMRSCTWAMAQQRRLHIPVQPWGGCLGDTDKHWPECRMSTGTSWVSPSAFTQGACLHQGLSSKLSYQHQCDTQIRFSPSSLSLAVPESLIFQGNMMEYHTRAGISRILSGPLRSAPNLMHIYIFRSILLELLSFQSDFILVPVHVSEAMTSTAVKLHYLCTLINSLITINGKSCWQAKPNHGIRITNIMFLYIFLPISTKPCMKTGTPFI